MCCRIKTPFRALLVLAVKLASRRLFYPHLEQRKRTRALARKRVEHFTRRKLTDHNQPTSHTNRKTKTPKRSPPAKKDKAIYLLHQDRFAGESFMHHTRRAGRESGGGICMKRSLRKIDALKILFYTGEREHRHAYTLRSVTSRSQAKKSRRRHCNSCCHRRRRSIFARVCPPLPSRFPCLTRLPESKPQSRGGHAQAFECLSAASARRRTRCRPRSPRCRTQACP